MTQLSAYRIGSDWAMSIDLGPNSEDRTVEDKKKSDPIAIHFVVDNSGSMGSNTKLVQEIFSEMVDSVATSPCSLTVFHDRGQVLSSDIESGQQMRELELPPQGMTNIPDGIKQSLRVVYGQEKEHLKQSSWISSSSPSERIHHILILLSDGHHNQGSSPEQVFPTLGNALPKGTKLSVVVVGFSQQSSSSMGMLLKKSIETVTFQADIVQTIYFATTKTVLKSALASLESGLNMAIQGTFHEIQMQSPCIVPDFASEPIETFRVHVAPDSSSITMLCAFDETSVPKVIQVDNQEVLVEVMENETISFELLSALIQELIDRTKVRIVAAKSQNSRKVIKDSVHRLEALYKILEDRKEEQVNFDLKSLSAKERVSRFRQIRRLCHGAGALKNQILDIANFSDAVGSNSENQASFLNGRSMKYANKALRRAAKNTGNDGVVMNPKAEQKSMQKWLTQPKFALKLEHAMIADVLENMKRLSRDQIQSVLLPQVMTKHKLFILEIHRKAVGLDTTIAGGMGDLSLSQGSQDLISSGQLADYLNDTFHGKRRSFISMSTPWQHLDEWKCFGDQKFDSMWEMLMYGGSVGYPLQLQRSAACQMNPFLIKVTGVKASLVDSASICCANQAEIPVYGPEAGEPIKDVLVLVDPSMPNSSKLVFNSKLLGEKLTSATIARDLQMYTGAGMKIALHANTLWHLLSSPANDYKKAQEDVVANLRRTFMSRAFQCPMCKFGPVDHFACSDLQSHHGENVAPNVSISNACPNCDWFSKQIGDWEEWDGTVPPSMLESAQGEKKATGYHLPASKIDLILRILYSFRKLWNDECAAAVRDEMVDKMMIPVGVDDFVFDFSAKAGVDGLSQLVITLLTCSDLTKVKKILDSQVCLEALIREHCNRHAREKFRKHSNGQKEMARQSALEYVTKLLGINSDDPGIPDTLPQMESEPPLENVRQDCSDDFELNMLMAEGMVQWVREIAKHWCRVWSFANLFVDLLESRKNGGGWQQLEHDMETGESYYEDVMVGVRQATLIQTPKDIFCSNDDVSELRARFLGIAVSCTLSGAANSALPAEASDASSVLNDAAREMRVRLYLQRVSAKMALWKKDGQRAIWLQARAADIVQFGDMVSAKRHVHGLDKQTFWGLWTAAVSSKDKSRILAFLSTANETFSFKHGSS